MRVFLAGATGVVGGPLVSQLLQAGHDVTAMTRSVLRAAQLQAIGAEPVVCDVFDAEALVEAVVSFEPDAVIHQLTDLPDTLAESVTQTAGNDRIRTEGTHNLIAAAKAAGADRFVAQSIAWEPRRASVEDHERQVLEIGGVVARYGRLYGPGTYYEDELPPPPRIQIDAAARATPPLLDSPPGIATIAEPDGRPRANP